ncbi:MAG: hypothetical protein KatS3mg115_1172 [Candidatus Poribacteria bacterium]|nr:MAG: hypothetical protein KatS3mg115_1172 [Candidatus Poribacteria bacterium]
MYVYLHLLHLMAAAGWFGVHVANDLLACSLRRTENPLERARAIRWLLLWAEMPLATLVPILGLLMVALQPALWRQGWVHIKLTTLVVLWLLMAVASLRSRRLLAALEAGDLQAFDRHWHLYLVLRVLAVLGFFLIFIAVVFRPGIPRPL